MPALTLDIKTPNTLEKMAKKTAKALERIAVLEKQVNHLRDKGIKSTKSAETVTKRREASAKKELSLTDNLAKHYLMVRDAVMIAWRAAKSMTLDAMDKGNELAKLTASMKFEVDMFSSGTDAGAQFKEIEKFAKGNVKLTKEMTDQWIKFRKASTSINVVTNEQAAGMLRVWADIRAISQSSEEATKVTDEWLSKFAEGPDVAARFLAQVKATHKEFAKIGTGELFKNMKGPLALEDKMEAASEKMTNALAPLTKLLNDLKSSFGDFLSKLAGNKMFKNFISEVAKDIRWFITEGLPAFGVAIEKFFSKLGEESEKFVQTSGAAIDKVGDFLKKAYDFLNPAQILRDMQNGPPPAPQAPQPRAPAEQKKTGMLGQKQDVQLAGITIQNLNVNGGSAGAEQIARSVRQEMQLLLQAGALSKGYA